MRRAGEEQGVKWTHVMTAIIMGGLLSLTVCLIILLLCSIGISNGWLRETSMDKLAIVSCVMGGFSGGVLTVRQCGKEASRTSVWFDTVLRCTKTPAGGTAGVFAQREIGETPVKPCA